MPGIELRQPVVFQGLGGGGFYQPGARPLPQRLAPPRTRVRRIQGAIQCRQLRAQRPIGETMGQSRETSRWLLRPVGRCPVQQRLASGAGVVRATGSMQGCRWPLGRARAAAAGDSAGERRGARAAPGDEGNEILDMIKKVQSQAFPKKQKLEEYDKLVKEQDDE